ncbi:MAG: hypothetical protein H7Y02_13750 [Candidatus Obscuribacterales bacterium]|nr:hypothetical protein [Steroidobacteraceae bacterium]
MSSRAAALAARRIALQARCALQRQQLEFQYNEIESHLSVIDRGILWITNIVRHPLWALAGVAGLAMLGPTKIINWSSRGLLLFNIARRLGSYIFNRHESAAATRSHDDD